VRMFTQYFEKVTGAKAKRMKINVNIPD